MVDPEVKSFVCLVAEKFKETDDWMRHLITGVASTCRH